jgi:hypothetical protein
MVTSRPPHGKASPHVTTTCVVGGTGKKKEYGGKECSTPSPFFHAPFLDLLEELQKCSDPLSSFAGRDREAGDSLIRLLQIGHIVHIVFVLLTVHTDPFTKTL